MSYEEFRRRIDTARNILVGAVPSPAGQIDQITYALIYKFMNDIDDKSASLPGGRRTYFSGEYEKYNWHALMASSLGAHERLELYRQAIQNMSKNEKLPPLFREIYQNAFLPFNSANVLNLFLKEMDKFDHSDSDDIGDAYEYLLSITGAQGDVGQFRTPRHIIKFIVEAINPTKDDSVLDPACGTAGFLISAYEHVKSQHDGIDKSGNKNDEKRLTSDESDKIHKNYQGFDIDPTMVRTAEVNMYLHGFTTPDICNHDTLSSEDYWDKKYDVILANPPFMTPKGGIQPHKKFSINANRAEVLFVDYIASHINPVSGRAGIVVPEGIIFQSGNAYKQLRKNLVEDSLYAVVSLPAGVFQPYSGVKTSILLLDKKLAKERDEILFVKVENDGYSLGAQRRLVGGDQFPEAYEIIERFKAGEELNSTFSHVVSRRSIIESGDCSLSGDRYKVNISIGTKNYDYLPINDLIINNPKSTIKVGNAKVSKGDVIFFTSGKEQLKYEKNLVDGENIFIATGGNANVFYYCGPSAYSTDTWSIKIDESIALTKYLYYLIDNKITLINTTMFKGAGLKHLDKNLFKSLQIPLPSIEIQREIVTELDVYKKIIDAAQTIIQNYKPTIKINSKWEIKQIGEVAYVNSGQSPDGKFYNENNNGVPFYQGKTEFTDRYLGRPKKWTTYTTKSAEQNDILISVRAPVGPVNLATEHICIGRGLASIRTKNENDLLQLYLYEVIKTQEQGFKSKSSGSTFESINRKDIETLLIPIPPIEIQREIVAELEIEQKLIDSNKKLIEIYQQKIKTKLAEVWGE